MKAWCTTRADSVAQESVKYILHKTCQKKSSEQNIYTFTISAFEIKIILTEMSGGGAGWRKDINLEPSSEWEKKTLLMTQFRHDLPNVDCTKEPLFSITNY